METLVHCGGNVNWYSHYGTSIEFTQKIKNRTAIEIRNRNRNKNRNRNNRNRNRNNRNRIEIRLLNVHLKEMKSVYLRNICTLM